jgi:ubiquitin-protein ligase
MSRTIKKKDNSKIKIKSLKGHFKRCTNPKKGQVHEHIKFVMSDEDVGVWYFVMGVMVDASEDEGQFLGNDDEFAGGQYVGKVTATKNYPFAPPDVVFLTPTEIYPINSSDFCVDIGKYHKENYPATLGMDGFVSMIWAGIMGWRDLGAGISLLHYKKLKKDRVKLIRKAAKNSKKYNAKHNRAVLDMFREFYGDAPEEPGLDRGKTANVPELEACAQEEKKE